MIQETFLLDPVPPFRLDPTVWALRRRLGNRIDQWDGTTYTWVLILDGQPVNMTVSERSSPAHPHLLVTASSLVSRADLILQRMLGVATNVRSFLALAMRDPVFVTLTEQFWDLNPPRFPTLFEALLNAFAGQQVRLEVGLLLFRPTSRALWSVLDR